jgi:hypothetical protein
MARVMIDATIIINGTNVSNQGNKVLVEESTAENDGTGFQTEFEQTEPGLKSGSIPMTLFQSYGPGSINTLLRGITSSGEPAIVVVTPKDEAVSATNPAFVMPKGKPFGYNPVDGSAPGSLITTDVTFKNVGQEGIVEMVTPKEVEEAEEAAGV